MGTESNLRKRRSTEFSRDDEPDSKTSRTANNLLKQIKLTNFMCHGQLTMSFGDRVNFIVGQNGSGKSAILNALQAVFGSSARATSRQSVKDWIRTENNGRMKHADVIISLNNLYKDRPYDYDHYGDTITIKRHITSSSSTYYVCGNTPHSAKYRKILKDDLNDITKWFNLQVDNPVHVMTQEESKRFLTSKTPKEKFNFFKLGTSLAQIERNYTDTAKILRDAANDIGLTKTAVDDLKMEEKHASSELNKLSRAKETDDKIKQALKILVWCPVKRNEENLAEKEKAISNAEIRVQKHTEARENETLKLAEAQKQLSDKNAEVTRFSMQQKELKDKLRPLNQARMNIQNSIRNTKTQVVEIKSQIRDYEKDISQIEYDRLKNADTKTRDQLVTKRERIKEIEEMIPNLRKRIEELRSEESEHVQHKEDLDKKRQDLDYKIRKIQFEMEKARNDHELYKKRQNQAQSAFGTFVPEVRRQILDANRAGKWHGALPIGPVGDYMKPLKPDYLGICEHLLTKPLNTYLYFDDNDKHLLQKILQRNCNAKEYRATQLVKMRHNEEPISNNPDFQRQKVNVRGHYTVHDCFKYDHPMVERYLCEWNSIQQLLIIPDQDECQRLIQTNHVARFAYTFKGQMYDQSSYNPCSRENLRAVKFASDVSGLIERAKQDYWENEKNKKNVEEERAKVVEEIDQLGETVQQKQILQSKREIDILTNEKRKTEDWIDANDITHQYDSYYVTEIQERRSKIMEENQRLLKCEDHIETYNEQLQKVQEDIEALGLDDDALKKRVEKQKEAITQIGEDIQKAQNSKDHYEKARKKYSDDLKRLKKEWDEIEVLVKSSTAKALKEVPKRPDVIPADEKKARDRIETQKREFAQNARYIERADEIEENYRNITEQYKVRKIELKHKKAVLKILEQRLDERHNLLHQLKRHVKERVSEYFTRVCRTNNFLGRINIDLEQERIDMLVVPCQDNASPDEVEQARNKLDTLARKSRDNVCQLSGGERSITTVAFLLALWERIKSPIRCLDEFEVFMDQDKKSRATLMLCQYASKHPKTQFVFLTPTGLSESKEALGKGFGNIFKYQSLQKPIRGRQPNM